VEALLIRKALAASRCNVQARLRRRWGLSRGALVPTHGEVWNLVRNRRAKPRSGSSPETAQYERRINFYSFLTALPGIILSGVLIWMQPWATESKFAAVVSEAFVWWILALMLHEQVIRPLQTLANVVGALREEDYSFRARGAATRSGRRGHRRTLDRSQRAG